ncbi:uncharacterized protein C8Q71DRAFT_246000 [Rhodofomes roseus]|uniref:Uncharacterized protein n=1 Tax=Rhodofomes roseus TaxID=34475 RepID=A0ABQ8K6T3_9APHY|nr:uncharacterized protein C8Q71DRAFT_246000 [Rhodofomes roseus]KAH9832962.1 hypothetical protein C8Q71DRAFT_246000 [Rhodofomes roseus]
MAERTSIHIVLEALDPSRGKFHWSLTLFSSHRPPNWSCVDLFQIVDTVATTSISDVSSTSSAKSLHSNSLSLPHSVTVKRTWHLAHRRTVDLLSPSRPQACVGAVRLPDADLPYNDLKEFIEEQEAEQGDTETMRGVPWSCAQWLMRVLARLMESGLYELDMNHFYPKIQRLGIELDRLRLADPNEVHVLDFA